MVVQLVTNKALKNIVEEKCSSKAVASLTIHMQRFWEHYSSQSSTSKNLIDRAFFGPQWNNAHVWEIELSLT